MRVLTIKTALICLVAGLLSGCGSGTKEKNVVEINQENRKVIELMKKQILLDSSRFLYDKPLIEKSNDYKFMVGTPLLDFVPGKVYKHT